MNPPPTVGRIVHYAKAKGTCYAAIVTEAAEDDSESIVGLAILKPEGLTFYRNIEADFSRDPESGTWHWPERV